MLSYYKINKYTWVITTWIINTMSTTFEALLLILVSYTVETMYLFSSLFKTKTVYLK